MEPTREELMEAMLKDIENACKNGKTENLSEIAIPGVKTPLHIKEDERK